MASPSDDELVKVADGGAVVDGIVFDRPSRLKVVVAVVDATRGPVFRTLKPTALSERKKAGADDAALRLLIRRTPQPPRGGARAGAGVGGPRSGHSRAASHRTTGK